MSKTQNIKQGYKHTAIGILPQDWEVVRLGEVCELFAGGDAPKENFSKFKTTQYQIPIFSNGIGVNALYGYTNKAKIDKPCITISARGTIGHCILHSEPFFPIVRLIVALPNSSIIIAFLKNYIDSIDIESTNAGIPQLTIPMISNLQIPLPPLKEQEKIARILSAWDNAIATLDSLIKAKQRYKKALMQRLLTPPCEVKTDKSPLPCGWDLGVGKIAQDKAKSTLDSFDITHPLALSAREGEQEASRTQKAPPLAGGVGVGYPNTNNNRNDESLTPSLRDLQCESNQSKSYRHCEALQKPKQSTQSLRFAGFTDKWQEFRLGDILQYEQPTKYLVKNTEYSDLYQTPVLTAGKTFILGKTNENFGVYKDLPVILFDDFMATSKFIDFPFKVKSSASKILKPKANNINLKIVFEIMQMIDFCAENHKRYWISEYQNLKIKLPTLAEQKKIAQILSACDKEIAILDSKLQCLKTQKRGLMQQLLSGIVRVKC